MKRLLPLAIVISVLSFANTSSVHAQETGFTPTERELHYAMKIWPGTYDNKEQINYDRRALGDALKDSRRLNTLIHPLSVSALGEAVLYAQERLTGETEALSQAVYVLEADEAERAIRVKQYSLNDPDKYVVEGRSSKTLEQLKARNVKYREGCDILLRRDNETLSGSTTHGACEGEDGTFLSRTIRLGENAYHIEDNVSDENGMVLDLKAENQTRKMKRARWFACMIDVPKDTPNRSNHTQHYMKIHDQGGAYGFTHPDGRDMTLIMQNTWSYGMQRETFVIAVLEGGETGQTLVYSWGMPGQDRIGVNPGYVRIQCDLDTPDNIALQKGLRSES